MVAAERGVSRLMLTEQFRDAIDQLAIEYEVVAYASVGEITALERSHGCQCAAR